MVLWYHFLNAFCLSWLILYVNLNGTTRCPDSCVCVFRRLAFELVTWVKERCLLPLYVGIIQSTEGLNRIKNLEERWFCSLLELKCPSFLPSEIGVHCSLAFLELGHTRLAPLFPRSSGSGLELHHQLFWVCIFADSKLWTSPPSKKKCMSQSLIINFFLYSVSVYILFCFLEDPDKYTSHYTSKTNLSNMF